jgi:hypothetical protein
LEITETIQAGLMEIKNNWLAYLMALTVVSSLAMAMLQAVKEMTRVRLNYNRRKLGAWLLKRAKLSTTEERCQLAAGAEAELRRLASDSDVFAFYGGDIASLCAQFSAAATILLDYPSLNPELFRMLTVYGTESDVRLLLESKPAPPVPLVPTQQYEKAELVKAAEDRQTLIDARNRVRHQLTQSIASFQTEAGSRWERLMKIWSWVISAALTFTLGALGGQLGGNNALMHAAELLLAAGISGFLAPIARDLVVAIQNLRD